ncbi:MAG: serine/threonine protein kinase, partial [Pirellulales bacterium]|nr:serine/threonine protein kinase [Pirellulales bacterium]
LRLWEISTGRCVRTFEGHAGGVTSVCLSADARWALSGSSDNTLRLWELDWDYEFPGWAHWDEAARPYLETFLTLHTSYAAALSADREPMEAEIQAALTRRGGPTWSDADFQCLVDTLGCAGFGWLRPEGVRKKLNEMAANWQGPPPLPWEQ